MAFQQGYDFRNCAGLAAAIEYSFHEALENKVTKKAIASKYSISTATLTKYNDELYEFVPADTE